MVGVGEDDDGGRHGVWFAIAVERTEDFFSHIFHSLFLTAWISYIFLGSLASMEESEVIILLERKTFAVGVSQSVLEKCLKECTMELGMKQ